MAKKTVKKTKPAVVKPVVVKPSIIEKDLTLELANTNHAIAELGERLDRIVAAISQSKNVKGM